MSNLDFLKDKPAKRLDWRWQVKNSHFEASGEFPMRVSPYYLSLIDNGDPDCPISKMALPSRNETLVSKGLYDDPIMEREHSPVPGLIRRYPDRAVLLVSGQCAVNCRHCTRRRLYQGNLRPVLGDKLGPAVEYLRNHKEIRDVIVSGGDPLLLEDEEILAILGTLRKIGTIETVRIGTRAPVTLPMRVTESLVDKLVGYKPLFVNTQFNHPKEITTDACEAVARFVDRGIPVANQAVLLRGVNDSLEVVEELCRSLHRIRVRPYYLFLCDLWNGIGHFRTSIQTGVEIMAGLRGRLSGMAIPELVADLPGGIGKIPIGPNYIVGRKGNATLLEAPDGRVVEYPDPEITPTG